MATYKSDMLNFGYNASLHVHHPTTSLIDLGERIGIATSHWHRHGDPRTTPNGTSLPGLYSDNYWCGQFLTRDQEDITDFLRGIVNKLSPQQEFLRSIVDTGGVLCVFINVGCTHCCAHQFDRHLLADLSAIGLGIRIDFYGADLPQRGLHPKADQAV